MQIESEAIEAGIRLFRRLAGEDEQLAAQLATSRAEFSQRAADGDPREDAAAARRHLEWFLFERLAPGARELPAESLLPAWRERAGDDLSESADAFLQSCPGMFEVSAVEPGEGAVLRDLAGLVEYAVAEPPASVVLAPGDLIVGRLYPVGETVWLISPAAGCFRDPQLVAALEHDLGRLRARREHALLRVTQRELEAMFWGAGSPATGFERGQAADPAAQAQDDPRQDARRALIAAGLAPDAADAALAQLLREPYDATTLAPGSGDPLGAMLELLAFETGVDLARARALLLRAWAFGAPPAATGDAGDGSAPAARAEVARAVAEFDRDRARGVDLERSFDALERRLGLEALGEQGEDEAIAPDFPGAVGAVVEEFLWEVERQDGAAAARELEGLRALGRFGRRIGVFENLNGREVLTFAAFWLPESGELRSVGEAARLSRALSRFFRWVEETQALEVFSVLAPTLSGLECSLPRVTRANLALEAPASASARQGALYELVRRAADGAAVVRDRSGAELSVALPPVLARTLEPGDRLRAARTPRGGFTPLCCYPPESASLLAADPA